MYSGVIANQFNFHNEIETAIKYLLQGGIEEEDLEVYGDTDTILQIINDGDFNEDVAILGYLYIS